MVPIKKNTYENNYIFGRNSVLEALKHPETVNKIFVSNGTHSGRLDDLVEAAKKARVEVELAEKDRLDLLSKKANHQGVVAVIKPKIYNTTDEILEIAEKNNELPFLVVCDKIQDPHNLGAILRTSECMGVHGVIIPKNRSAEVNFTVSKTSAGASAHLPVARVTNICREIDYLKSKNLWIFGAESDGKIYYNGEFRVPLALVVGSEGNGISYLVRKKCDFILKIPMFGKVNSLNVSNAASILMAEIAKQRNSPMIC